MPRMSLQYVLLCRVVVRRRGATDVSQHQVPQPTGPPRPQRTALLRRDPVFRPGQGMSVNFCFL